MNAEWITRKGSKIEIEYNPKSRFDNSLTLKINGTEYDAKLTGKYEQISFVLNGRTNLIQLAGDLRKVSKMIDDARNIAIELSPAEKADIAVTNAYGAYKAAENANYYNPQDIIIKRDNWIRLLKDFEENYPEEAAKTTPHAGWNDSLGEKISRLAD